ncbi:MAG: M42 family peptidase, partial [Planctomycetia bacterium]
MESSAREFLVRLLETPSPSGYEQPIQRVVRDYLSGIADTVVTDPHGNVIGAKNPAAPMRMLLAGHCDQIGLIVQYIDSDGFIS